MGAYTQPPAGVPRDLEMVYDLFPRLKERRSQVAGTLSGGEQQMLAMGRALMSHPKLLMLDEPSMGLAPILVEQIFDIIKDLNQKGSTILLVEQNAEMALQVADRDVYKRQVPSVIYRAVWLSEVWWVSAVSAEVSGVVTAAVPVPPARCV